VAPFLLFARVMRLGSVSGPVRRIAACQQDVSTLALLQAVAPAAPEAQPEDYRHKVVLKPWGHEYLIFENASVAAWFLHIRHGYSTSMHCHPRKKTSLIVLTGHALCNTFEFRNYLNAHEALVLDRGVFHSTKALSDGGLDLIEIETPPAKTDLVRLSDLYGRQASGYEGLTEMQTERLDRFGYFHLQAGPATEHGEGRYADTGGRYQVGVQAVRDGATLADEAIESPEALYGVLSGRLVAAAGAPAAETGDTVTAFWLDRQSPVVPEGSVLLMKTGPLARPAQNVSERCVALPRSMRP